MFLYLGNFEICRSDWSWLVLPPLVSKSNSVFSWPWVFPSAHFWISAIPLAYLLFALLLVNQPPTHFRHRSCRFRRNRSGWSLYSKLYLTMNSKFHGSYLLPLLAFFFCSDFHFPILLAYSSSILASYFMHTFYSDPSSPYPATCCSHGGVFCSEICYCWTMGIVM